MKPIDTIKEKIDVAEDVARKIWLAGLGAYGKSYDEVQGRYEQLSSEANKMFDELVEKGTKLESEAKEKIKTKTALDSKVEEIRGKLGLNGSATEEKLEALTQKVDALTEAVHKLAK